MKQAYKGQCHCGAVKFSFVSEPIANGIRCNCSMCARKGALMLNDVIAPEEITIEAEPDALGLYQFDTGVAEHYFCKHCGIYIFHVTMRVPGHYRVNLGCVEGVETFALAEPEFFDGKHLL